MVGDSVTASSDQLRCLNEWGLTDPIITMLDFDVQVNPECLTISIVIAIAIMLMKLQCSFRHLLCPVLQPQPLSVSLKLLLGHPTQTFCTFTLSLPL